LLQSSGFSDTVFLNEMNTENRETEIKLPLPDLDMAARAMEKLNAEVVTERHLEDNFLLDLAGGALAKERKLLRIRMVTTPYPPYREIKTILTYKGSPDISDGIKQREEVECEVKDASNLKAIFSRLEYGITFRYQKFRTIYRPPNGQLDICIDETPIGNFYELEGEILRIHEFATRLGFNRDDYITQSYASLYFRWCQKTGSQEPFMIFPDTPKNL
jgi:adenylate cyclase, class 2